MQRLALLAGGLALLPGEDRLSRASDTSMPAAASRGNLYSHLLLPWGGLTIRVEASFEVETSLTNGSAERNL